jgi:hypothetical protein
MWKTRLAIIVLCCAILLGLGVLFGLFLPRLAGVGQAPPPVGTTTLLTQVQGLAQLVTVKYVLEKIVVATDPPTNPLRQLFPDNTYVALVAHGVVKAGVDLQEMKAEHLRADGPRIAVALPPARITDAYLDEQKTQVIERNTGLLRSFNKDLEQTARQMAVDDLRRAARQGGILKEAEERAREQLRQLLKQVGFAEIEFTQQ